MRPPVRDVEVLLELGVVTVGGRTETRRGRQLRAGDVVAVGEERVRVVPAAPSGPGA